MANRKKKKFFLFLAIMGPGVITAAADNDAGGIITCIQAGAKYRYDLLWVIFFITIILAMIQEMCARMGCVTQKGLGELIRENFGVKWTMFALGTLLVANLATTVAEFAGIAVAMEIFGVPRIVSIPIAATAIWILVVKGSLGIVEKVFMGISVLYLTYIASGIMAKPNWHEIMSNVFFPRFETVSQAEFLPFLFLTIAIIGTTITPWMQFFLQASVVDKGVSIRNYKYQKWDVYIGSVLTDLVAFFIIVTGAVMIYNVAGGPVTINNAKDAADALKPVAGNFAMYLFATGLLGASLLAAAVLPLSTAYTYSEAFGWEIGISRKFEEAPIFYGIYTFCIIFGSVVVLFPQLNLIDAIIRAQAVNGILLPVILVFMLKLINRKDVMGEYVNSQLYNIVIWFLTVVIIVLTIAWLAGLCMGLG